MTDEPIYTEDRVKRIRTVLWIVVGVGVLLASVVIGYVMPLLGLAVLFLALLPDGDPA